ncbi:DUF401 family protein [Geoglobus acetivorans]|uniref:DUF401 family protein n=1 Tax=Geoglobus acetivorans TaxID=565033 RepID=A0ABZ3H1W8_GEOAI|nr:DUF401 family protein [Geoglobus acetivorans]
MDVVVALFVSIIIILALIKFEISLAVLAGALFLALSTNPESIEMALTDVFTWKLVAIVILAHSIGYAMEITGMLDKITDSVFSLSGKYSVAIIPMLIGLLPMPGGALVSAVMIKELIQKLKIGAEKAVFINYWFRHVWVTFWPLYPNIVIAMGILSVNYLQIASSTFPILISMIAAGAVFLRIKSNAVKSKANFENLKYMYPVLLIVFFAVLTGDLLAALLISFISIILANKAFSKVGHVLGKAFDWKIIVLVIGVMIYKSAIQVSGASQSFYSEVLSFSNPYVASFALTFLIGFATGIELSYTSVALPLLTSFTGVGEIIRSHVLLVFLGGITGVILSPMHLCLVLTAQYFKADLYRVYRYLIPASLISMLISLSFLTVL